MASGTLDEALVEIRSYHPIEQPIEFYVGYLVLLFGLDVVFGEMWAVGHVLVNAMAMAVATGLVARIACALFDRMAVVVASGAMFAGCWETLQWIAMTQSDPVFVAIVCLALSCLVGGVAGGRSSSVIPLALLAAGIATAGLAVRPTGMPLFVFIASAGVAVAAVSGLRQGEPLVVGRVVAATVLVSAPVLLVAGAALLYSPELAPTPLIPKIVEYGALARDGTVVNSRPETYIANGTSLLHYIQVVFVRFFYFFSFVSRDFSFIHLVINIVFFVPFYGLVAVGIVDAIYGWTSSRTIGQDVSLLLLAGVVVFAVFHSITLIDFDWRYRAPTHPMMVVIGAHGLSVLASRTTGFLRSTFGRKS